MYSFQEKNISSLFIWGNVLTLHTAQNFLILCQMVLLHNINYLISKQNKKLRIDIQKCWTSSLALPFLDMSCLLHKKIEPYNQIQINRFFFYQSTIITFLQIKTNNKKLEKFIKKQLTNYYITLLPFVIFR